MDQPADGDPSNGGHSIESIVLTYAVPAPIRSILGKVCGTLGVLVWDATDLTDLIAVPNFLTVCSFSGVTPTRLGETYGYLLEVADKATALLLTDPPPVQPPERLRKHVVKTPEKLDEQFLRLLVIRRMTAIGRYVKTARSYDKKLSRLFYILRAIRAKGFVHSRDFCTEFNVSQRTVARDIELLMAMGEPIDYDPRRKGYYSLGDVIGCT